MKKSDLLIGTKVEFKFAGSILTGEIKFYEKEMKHNVDVSRYSIHDDEDWVYPIAFENILKIIK